MIRAICAKCRGQYNNKSEPDSIFCQHCQIRSSASNVRIYQVVSVICLTFALIFLGVFSLLQLVPLVKPNFGGYGFLDATTILMMDLVNFGLMIIFLGLFIYFKVKLDKAKMRFKTKMRLVETENKDMKFLWKDE